MAESDAESVPMTMPAHSGSDSTEEMDVHRMAGGRRTPIESVFFFPV